MDTTISPEDRRALLRRMDVLVATMMDGGIYTDWDPAFNEVAYALEEARAAPAHEAEVMIDLIRRPPSMEEIAEAPTMWNIYREGIAQYALAYFVLRPDEFAPVAEEAVVDERIGEDVVRGLAYAAMDSSEFDVEPYRKTLERAAGMPWTEEHMRSILICLSEADPSWGLEVLSTLRRVSPSDPRYEHGFEQTRRAMEGE